ncbi:hypothetical protein LTR85_000165 [Meristemomyces frigidus]|nr:hypothetical protein LTR85_000165 [Meristemomyces frigidus]
MDNLNADDRSAVKKTLYAAQLFFVTSIGLTRTSTALFTARILTLGEQHRRLAYAMISVCGISTPVFLLVIALRSPLLKPWDTIDGSEEMFARWLVVEILGLVIDASTLAFSMIIIWRLQMPVWKRVTVCTLFGVRLLIVPVVATRLAQLHPSAHGLPRTYNSVENILTEAELQFFLILASATCLKPLFQPFHPGFFAATDTNIAVTGYTNRPGGNNSSREAYYELSGAGSRGDRDRKQPVSRTPIADDASDEVDLVQPHHQHPPVAAMRPDEGETWSEAVAGSNAEINGTGDGRGIEATRTWVVSYEQRNASGF